MAKLETQINQIYLTHPESKKTSLILYEEALSNTLHLFILAQLQDLSRKSEARDLKKISEIILVSFRTNKKLSGETLFETALSQINQNLADIAHEGHKSWVGKFSCLIVLKSSDNIYLANNGQTAAWLKRKSELMEILPAEKRGTHPLKTFVNFTQGKLLDGDNLIIATSNIFNYVSFELFQRLLNERSLNSACGEISKILKDSMNESQGFCAFLLEFSKKSAMQPTEEVLEIYAPLPEETFTLPKLPVTNWHLFSFRFEKLKIPKLKFFSRPGFQNLSPAGKFFLISFTIFLLLFLIKVGSLSLQLQGKKTQAQIENLINQINDSIGKTESALIYRNDNDAVKFMSLTQNDFDSLQKLDPAKAAQLAPKIEQLKIQVNKINIVNDPKIFVELKHKPTYLSRASIGFLFANKDSNSLSLYNNKLTDYFLLNSLKNDITGISYFTPAGVVVSAGNQIFHLDNNLKQFLPILAINNANIAAIKNANNALYVLDRNNQVVKVASSKTKYISGVSARGEFKDARDIAVDKDIYVLYPDHVTKFVSGQPQAFPLPNMTDQLTNGTKIFTASNLYILESNKKRLIIMSKTGVLINQIYFPTTTETYDFYVDEPARAIYLLDDNKLYKITF